VAHAPNLQAHLAARLQYDQVVVVDCMAGYQADPRRLRENNVLLTIYSVGAIVIVEMMRQV